MTAVTHNHLPADDVIPSKLVRAAAPGDFNKFRKILVSPTANTPEPFKGFGGWCGWPDVCRLKNGDLFVTFSAGYWHASWPTPIDVPPQQEAALKSAYGEWLFDWDCPTGGKTMWIRSRDNGKTWTRPKAFPEVVGGYYASDVIQLRDGTMLASVYVSNSWGYWQQMPATPLEFARTAANRLDAHSKVYRSDDNGESWHAAGQIASFGENDAVYSFCESPDGSVLALYNFSPIPGGANRWLTAVARSTDKGTTWKTLSIAGSNDFNSYESTGGYLPDGRIGFITRVGSHWFESSDHGRTWSESKQVFPLVNGKSVGFRRGSLQVLPDGVVAVVYCDLVGKNGQLIYSRDNGKSWIKPAEELGFKFDPLAYYPDACVLEDGSLFVVGSHEGLGENKYGPAGAEVTAMRFRIKSANAGEGIELLPIGSP